MCIRDRVNTELLRQVTEDAADLVFLTQDVDAVERDGAGVGILQRGDGAHEGTFAGAVWAHQAEHAVSDGESQVLERLYTIRVSLGKPGDRECHFCLHVSRMRLWTRTTDRIGRVGTHFTTNRRCGNGGFRIRIIPALSRSRMLLQDGVLGL